MIIDFEKLRLEKDLLKTRFIFVAAFLCSFLFYYFMVQISPEGLDFLPGRILIAVVSLAGLAVTYWFKNDIRWTRVFINLVSLTYFGVYLYLAYLNHWTVFYRWSYAVAATILCAVAIRWWDFVFLAVIGTLASIFAALMGPMTALEQIHFHSANLTLLVVIGFTLHSNFRYQQELYQASQNLIEASKMSALGRMAGGIAHEINSPLQIIQMSMDLILKNLNEEQFNSQSVEFVRTHALRASSTVDRIASIIRGLLVFSRNSPVDLSDYVSLGKIIENTRYLCSEKLKKNEIELVVSPVPACEIRTQESQLIQVFLNLINNAVDALAQAERKTIRIESKMMREDLVRICIIDSGSGVSKEVLPHLMEPFFTTKPVGQGTGLGLSISRAIIEKHGGKFFYDEDSKESSFVMEIPCRLTGPLPQSSGQPAHNPK